MKPTARLTSYDMSGRTVTPIFEPLAADSDNDSDRAASPRRKCDEEAGYISQCKSICKNRFLS